MREIDRERERTRKGGREGERTRRKKERGERHRDRETESLDWREKWGEREGERAIGSGPAEAVPAYGRYRCTRWRRLRGLPMSWVAVMACAAGLHRRSRPLRPNRANLQGEEAPPATRTHPRTSARPHPPIRSRTRARSRERPCVCLLVLHRANACTGTKAHPHAHCATCSRACSARGRVHSIPAACAYNSTVYVSYGQQGATPL